jgi:hypothetical protein
MNRVHEDLPKCKEVVLERPADRLLGVAHGDEAPCARWRESLSKLRITVLWFDVGSNCAVLCCALLPCAVLSCAVLCGALR